MSINNVKNTLAQSLVEIKAIKKGEFTLRSGEKSPIYVDLRTLIAYPLVWKTAAMALWEVIQSLEPRLLCGIAYTALPLAACIALNQDLPMVICRKENKNYGTKKQVEGVFTPGQNCLIIEDVVTTAGSILDTITILKEYGLVVTDAVCLVDREQGGRGALTQNNIRLHSVFTLKDLINTID